MKSKVQSVRVTDGQRLSVSLAPGLHHARYMVADAVPEFMHVHRLKKQLQRIADGQAHDSERVILRLPGAQLIVTGAAVCQRVLEW